MCILLFYKPVLACPLPAGPLSIGSLRHPSVHIFFTLGLKWTSMALVEIQTTCLDGGCLSIAGLRKLFMKQMERPLNTYRQESFFFFFLKILFMLSTKGQKCALHECGSSRGSFPEPILAQLSRTLCKPKSFYKASLRTFNCCGWNYKGLSECHVTWKLALLHNQLFVLFIRFYLKWTRTAHSNNSFQH